MADRDKFVAIGKIVKAHGLKGALKVFSYAESPNVYRTGGDIFMEADETDFKPVKMQTISDSHRHLIVQMNGVNDRTQAEALIGRMLFVEKAALPATEPDEYYWFDLIGLAVVSNDQETIGVLTQILQTGSNDVYVVRDPQNGHETLVPSLKSVVREVNLDKGYMRVELPDGLR